MRAEWIAVSVETPRTAEMSEKARQQLMKNLRLAEQLGAETVTLGGERIIDEILDYARSRNVTKIVVGKTNEPWWRLRRSLVNGLIRRSGILSVLRSQNISNRQWACPKRAIGHDGVPAHHRGGRQPDFSIWSTAGRPLWAVFVASQP
jgi:K+-sensing histidine kinase KdpD